MCVSTIDLYYANSTKSPWTAANLDKTGHFVLEVAFSNILSTAKVYRDPDWNTVLEWASGYSALASRCTHGRRWKHVCAPDSWLMLCHVREQDPDPSIGTASRAPHHNATEPRGTDPNRANGSRSWAPYRPSVSLSAPVSSSDPNTNWHLINILSEGFISLTSRCLSSFSPLKTIDALITQNSICTRERDPRPVHSG